jgi:hypothetical protein
MISFQRCRYIYYIYGPKKSCGKKLKKKKNQRATAALVDFEQESFVVGARRA